MREYVIDGVSLEDGQDRWFLDGSSQLPATGGPRVALVSAPGMHGSIPVRQGWENGKVSLSVVVYGDEDSLSRRVSYITQLFTTGRELTLREADQSRTARILASDVAEPVFRTPTSVTLKTVLTVSPFWVDDSGPVVFAPVYLSGGGSRLGVFDPGTGPLVDAVVRVSGPSNGVTVSGRDGSSVVFPALDAGEYGFVDLGSRRGWVSLSESDWDGTDVARSFVPDFGAAGWLEITPGPDGYVLSASGDMGSLVAVRAGRWFL